MSNNSKTKHKWLWQTNWSKSFTIFFSPVGSHLVFSMWRIPISTCAWWKYAGWFLIIFNAEILFPFSLSALLSSLLFLSCESFCVTFCTRKTCPNVPLPKLPSTLYAHRSSPARKISFWYTIKSLFSLSRPSLLAGVAGLLKHAPLSVGSSPEGDFLRENSILFDFVDSKSGAKRHETKNFENTRHVWRQVSQKKTVGSFHIVFVVLSLSSSSYFLITTTTNIIINMYYYVNARWMRRWCD